MHRNRLVATWKEFLAVIERRFGPLAYDDYKPQLLVQAMGLPRLFDGTNMDHKYSHKLREDNYISEQSVGIFRNSSLPPFLPTTSGNHVTQQVMTKYPTVKDVQHIEHLTLMQLDSVGELSGKKEHIPEKKPNLAEKSTALTIKMDGMKGCIDVKRQDISGQRKIRAENFLAENEELTEAWEQIERLKGEQKRRITFGYFLVSATIAMFHGQEHVPIFSLPSASFANQSMLPLLAIINCHQSNQRDRVVSLKYWSSGPGCRWKKILRRSCRRRRTYPALHLEDKVLIEPEGIDTNKDITEKG